MKQIVAYLPGGEYLSTVFDGGKPAARAVIGAGIRADDKVETIKEPLPGDPKMAKLNKSQHDKDVKV